MARARIFSTHTLFEVPRQRLAEHLEVEYWDPPGRPSRAELLRRVTGMVVLTLASLSAEPAAHAEHLIASVSNHRVAVTPNYTGEELVLFGSIERDAVFKPRLQKQPGESACV